jgi:glycosyltransferase involved in cell wall biosynthesis
VKKGFFNWLNRFSDGFLAIGSLNRDYYRHYGIPDDKIFPVPYAVDNDFFRAGADQAAAGRELLRRELEMDPRRPVILFVSKVDPRKRPADLLAAFQNLTQNRAAAGSPICCLLAMGPSGSAWKKLRPEETWIR